ncbi:MAG TPA: LLM class flavin-dependent oxidoreductase [Candidatus Dormibacteraeota bacterium]|nr:LLM class flavin-dependent oxidoreductase [Candidatus Dormibacteraeota bacterium]
MTRFAIQLHGTFPMHAYPDLARAVERHPFAELTVHDVVWWRPVWPILTLIGAHTERVRVGPDVTHPLLLHPLATAASVAALDELTGGRAVLGVGRGSLLEPAGISPAPPDAVPPFVEEVQRHVAGSFWWHPPRPRIPVFVGTFGRRMVELACAGWADEIRPPGTWDTRFFEDVRRRVAGRVPVGCEVWTVVDADRERARDLGREVLARFLPHMGAMTRFYGVDPLERPIPDRTLDLFVAAGTPADVAAGVERLVAAGAATITFSGRLGPDPRWAIHTLGTIIAAE